VQGYFIGKPAPIGQYRVLVGHAESLDLPARKTG
jgi:hypothetical protein